MKTVFLLITALFAISAISARADLIGTASYWCKESSPTNNYKRIHFVLTENTPGVLEPIINLVEKPAPGHDIGWMVSCGKDDTCTAVRSEQVGQDNLPKYAATMTVEASEDLKFAQVNVSIPDAKVNEQLNCKRYQ